MKTKSDKANDSAAQFAEAKREVKAREVTIRKKATSAATAEELAGLASETEKRERPIEQILPAPTLDSPSTVLALIERVALDPRPDVEKLECMVAMYERLKAKEAELSFNAAKGRIMKKLAGIKIVKNKSALYEVEEGKPQKGTYEAFKYAPLEEIDKHLRPLLAEENMDLSFSDESQEGGDILIRGRLKHLAAITKIP